jgi:hypothetical protein
VLDVGGGGGGANGRVEEKSVGVAHEAQRRLRADGGLVDEVSLPFYHDQLRKCPRDGGDSEVALEELFLPSSSFGSVMRVIGSVRGQGVRALDNDGCSIFQYSYTRFRL